MAFAATSSAFAQTPASPDADAGAPDAPPPRQAAPPPEAPSPPPPPAPSPPSPPSPPAPEAAPAPPPPQPAAATPADQAQSQSPARLSDVVVTAKKREERVQDVPIPITVAGGKQLVEKNITTSNDVERLSPNLSGQVTGNRSARPRWFLRGIGTNDPSVNLESPLGVYFDEVFVAYVPLQSFPLFDLERIEVLKGPQGTLWGKNTTGGAIHFVSKKPTFDPSGYLKAGIGNYGSRTAEAAFGGGVAGDWLAARAAFYYEELGGWATNLRDNSKGPQFNDFATRLQLLATPSDNLDILVSGRYRLNNNGAAPSYPVGVGGGGAIKQYPAATSTYTPVYGANPRIGDPFLAGTTVNPLQTSGVTATANWHLGGYTLTLISAIDEATNTSLSYSYWPDPTFDQTGTYSFTHSRQYTGELRVSSPKADRFNWIAGVNYFHWYFFNDAETANFGPVAGRKNYLDNRIRQKDVSPAAFASAKFGFTEDLGITAGLRYTYDKKDVDTQRLNSTGAGVAFSDRSNWYDPSAVSSPLNLALSIPASASWSQLTYDITPEYRLGKDALLFFRFAKGFRAGAFNPAIIPASGGNPAYLPKANPEILYDWELGAKTSWLDGRVVANLAAFYYRLDDIQLNVQQPNPMGLQNAQGSTVQNAASGNIKGVEVEVNAAPVRGLQIQGGLGLLRSEYTDFTTYQGAAVVDASGNTFYRTPQVSGVVAVEYSVPLSRDSALGIGTDWLYRSRIFHNAVVQGDRVQETPRYAIGNAELRYSVKGGRLVLLGYVKNLADTNYKILSQVVAAGAYPTTMGNPRTYGLQLIARF